MRNRATAWAFIRKLVVCVMTLSITMSVLAVHEQVSAAAGQILKLFAPGATSTFYVGRCFRMDFKAQTDNLDANSVDILLPYNSSYVQPYTNSGCTLSATAINTTGLFPAYPANTISSSLVTVTAYDPSGSSPVDTGSAPADRVLGYVYWKVLSASGSFNLRYNYTQDSTIDTNMAENNGNGTDVLDAVENLSAVLAVDGSAPTFTSLSPSNGATGVSVTSTFSLTASDAESGIHSGSLALKANGTYQTLGKTCARALNSNVVPSCDITANPGTLNYLTTYTMVASGSDVASPTRNWGTQTWSFTTEDDDDAPYVEDLNPLANATGVAVGSNIVMHIKDYKDNAGVTPGLGVDTSTIEVTVTVGSNPPVTYQDGDPEFSASGIAANRTVTINPSSNFPENTLIQVSVEASDLHSPGNAMSTFTYSFRTVDSQGPTFSGFSPAQSATDVDADTNVVFHILDNGSGVDINNTSVTIEGITYTSASPQFSYAGTSSDYTITINPSSNFLGSQVVDVSISTRDLASTPNTVGTSYSFTIENACTTCFVDSEDPARFSTSATLDTTISFRVHDTGAGIDEDSIVIKLIGTGPGFSTSPLTLTGGSALVSISGTSANYLVTITLPAAIQENVPVGIVIDASDINSLDMSTVAYTFMNLNVTPSGGSCTTTTTETIRPESGGRRGTTTENTIENLTPEILPTVIERRRLPEGTFSERQLTPEEARRVHQCYIDVPLHGSAPEPLTPFADVEPGIWYEQAVSEFVERGILDGTATLFRATDASTRAEMAKMLVKLAKLEVPAVSRSSFDDVEPGTWYRPFVEKAAEKGWMLGYGNCYGTRPCMAKPAARITRAEAAAMIIRFYGYHPVGLAPAFPDVAAGAWYSYSLQAARNHCIVQGNPQGLAEPDRLVTRAELTLMLYRASLNLRYGWDCGVPQSNASPLGSNVLEPGALGTNPAGFMLLLSAVGGVALLARKNTHHPKKRRRTKKQ